MAYRRLPLFLLFLCVATIQMVPASAQRRGGIIQLKEEKLRLRQPRGWLSASTNAFLPHRVHLYHPSGARFVLTKAPKKTKDTLLSWTNRYESQAKQRRLQLSPAKTIEVSGQPAIRLSGRTNHAMVEIVFFFYLDQVILITFSCDARGTSTCQALPDFERILSTIEPMKT